MLNVECWMLTVGLLDCWTVGLLTVGLLTVGLLNVECWMLNVDC